MRIMIECLPALIPLAFVCGPALCFILWRLFVGLRDDWRAWRGRK